MQEIQMARKTAAYKIHMDIMAAGEVAAEAFSTFCRLLKTMRDDKLYVELEYGSFEAYCENAVGIKYRQAFNYIKVLENFGDQNLQSNAGLGIRKLELLGSVPEESREKLLEDAKEMTTREVEKAVREYKSKLSKAEDEIKKTKEFADKQSKYADEHMMRARQAEKEIMDKEKSMQTLRLDKSMKEKEIVDLQQQLDQAKRNSDPEKVRKLLEEKNSAINELNETKQRLEWARKGGNPEKIQKLEQEINGLQQQLHDKPIEVAATQIVEKEIIPDEVAEAIYCKIKYLYEGIKNLTAKEIQIFADHVDPAYYDTLTSDIDEATVILEKISAAAYGATNMIEPEGHCGDCVNADMDAVTEEQLDEGKTLCTVANQIVDIEHSCHQYKFYGAQS